MCEQCSIFAKLLLLSLVIIFIGFPYGAQSAAISRAGYGNFDVAEHFTITKTVMTFVDHTYPCPGTVVQTGPEPTDTFVETSQVAAVGATASFNTGELPSDSFSVLVDPNPFNTETEATAVTSSVDFGTDGLPTETFEAAVDPNPFTTASFPAVTDIPEVVIPTLSGMVSLPVETEVVTPTLPGIVPLPIATKAVTSSIAAVESTADLPVFSLSSLLEGIIPSSEIEVPVESSTGAVRETEGTPEVNPTLPGLTPIPTELLVTPTLPGLKPIPTELLASLSAIGSQDASSQPDVILPAALTESPFLIPTEVAESTEVLGADVTAGGYGWVNKAKASDMTLSSEAEETPIPSPVFSASNGSVTDSASVPEFSPSLSGTVSLPVESSPATTLIEAVGSERLPGFTPTQLDISEVSTGISAHPTGDSRTKDSSYFPGFVFVDEESQSAFEIPTAGSTPTIVRAIPTLSGISQLIATSAPESSNSAVAETASEIPLVTPTLPEISPLSQETEALSVAAVGGSRAIPEISSETVVLPEETEVSSVVAASGSGTVPKFLPTSPGIVSSPIVTPAASAPIEIVSSPETSEVLPGIIPLSVDSQQSQQEPTDSKPTGHVVGYYGLPPNATATGMSTLPVTSVAAVGSEQQPTGEEFEPESEATSWAIPMPTIPASNSSVAVSELTPQVTSAIVFPEVSSVDAVGGSKSGVTTVGDPVYYPMNRSGPAPQPAGIKPEATSVAGIPGGQAPGSQGASVAAESTMAMPAPPPVLVESPTAPQSCPPEQTRIIYLAAPDYYRTIAGKNGGYKLRKRDLEHALASRQEVKIADFACNYMGMSELCTTVTTTMTRTHFVIPTDCGSLSERADTAGVAAWQKPGFRVGHH